MTDAPRVIGGAEVRRLVPMGDAVGAVREAFRELGAGAFALPPRVVLGGGKVLVMAAYHEPTGSAVVKTVSVELDRVPAISGTLVWTDAGGRLVADAAAVTALRTGAIVGVATDALAEPDASVLALIGAGGQAADQVRAVHAVRPLSALNVFARDRVRAEVLLAGLATELTGVELRASPTVAAALADAQVVCCATSSSTPVFEAGMLPGRVHVNAIGSFRPSMRELPEGLLASAGLLVVDQAEAATTEAGEIIHALRHGAISAGDLRELATVLDERPAALGRTVFKTVGVAVQDWAIARLLGAVPPG